MRWCVVLFLLRSCFIQTENNTYINKQNKEMTISNIPSCATSHVSLCALNVKASEFSDCTLSDFAVFLDPFHLILQSSRGGGVGSLCACFELTVHLIRAWNVLVVYSCFPSATVATSSNMYWIFFFYVLCFFLFFFVDLFFCPNTLWWLGGRGGSPVAGLLLWLQRHFSSHIYEYLNID